MNNDELEQYYLNTTYSVYIDETKFDIKIGQSVPDVIKKTLDEEKEKTAVILTAWNPRSQLFPLLENQNRNNELKANLLNNHYTVFNAIGQGADSSWPAEESFFIVGITKENAEQYATNFGQYAYVLLEIDKKVSLEFSTIWYK